MLVEMSDPEPPSPGKFWRPFFISMCLMPINFLTGTALGQSAGMLPQLLDEGSLLKIDRDQATWISSLPMIGAALATYVSGSMSDIFGRTRVAQVAYFFFAVGNGVMVAANSFTLLAVGRFLVGLGVGCSFATKVYISEISPPAYRGVFLSFCAFISSVGLVYMYVVGGYLPWNIGAGTEFLISIFGLVLTLFLHDTPVWLVQNNKINSARKSLKLIQGSKNIDAKLKEIQDIAACQQEIKFSLTIFTEPTVWKPFITIFIMSVLQNVAGFYIVLSYTVQFMQQFRSAYDPLQITIAVGVARMLSMAISSYLHKIIGRRHIGALSGFSCAALLFLIYAYLKLEVGVPFLHENSWISVGLFLIYISGMSLGIYPLPWALPYEMFPLEVRGRMVGLSFSAMCLVFAISVKSYNLLMDNLMLEGVILLFAVGSFLFGLFSITILVETHDKTLDEIEAIFAGRKRKSGKVEGRDMFNSGQ